MELFKALSIAILTCVFWTFIITSLFVGMWHYEGNQFDPLYVFKAIFEGATLLTEWLRGA